jgi:TrmH family RNA methyltransferase
MPAMDNKIIIESPHNAQVKELAALTTKKGRRESGRFTAEGVRPLRDALSAENVVVHRLAVEADRAEDENIAALIRICSARKIPVLFVTRRIMEKISRMETPQGVLAEVSLRDKPDLESAGFKGFTLLAHGIQDPRNMGLLLRTSEAAGVKTFISTSGSTDPFHPTAAQTSMGAVFYQNIISGANAAKAVGIAKRKGAAVFGTAVRGGLAVDKWLKNLPADFVLVLGNEGAGLDEEVARSMDANVSLPMWGRAESLNVAVAAGVLLYLARLEIESKRL